MGKVDALLSSDPTIVTNGTAIKKMKTAIMTAALGSLMLLLIAMQPLAIAGPMAL